MQEPGKMKVFIIEDHPEQMAMAMAGLIPVPIDGGDDNIGLRSKVGLSEKHFAIATAQSIAEAVNAIPFFKPDLLIIDIDLGDSGHALNIKNGIDLYRWAGTLKGFQCERILFSSHLHLPKIFNQLTGEEKKDFIPKGSKQIGYEMLAASIAAYLKRIARKILQSASARELVTLRHDAETKFFRDMRDYPRQLGDLHISPANLLLFCSYGAMVRVDKSKVPALEYENPIEELLKLIPEKKLGSLEPKDRSKWTLQHVQDALTFYNGNFGTEFEEELRGTSKKIIEEIFTATHKPSHKRLWTYNLKHFDPSSFKNSSLSTNPRFRQNFSNMMVLRRVIIFVEFFAREFIDNSDREKTISAPVRDFLKNYVTQIFEAVKKHPLEYDPKQITQYGDMLNFSFKKDRNSEMRTETCVEETPLLKFEKKWMSSITFSDLTDMIYSSVKR